MRGRRGRRKHRHLSRLEVDVDLVSRALCRRIGHLLHHRQHAAAQDADLHPADAVHARKLHHGERRHHVRVRMRGRDERRLGVSMHHDVRRVRVVRVVRVVVDSGRGG